jgi:hypothetical protein
MDCTQIEERLSEYIEASLPAEAMKEMAHHLQHCRICSDLIHEMRSLVTACQSYPSLEMDSNLLEKILLRTSGRPRTRSFGEQLYQYLVRPLMTPQYAAGASLVVLFVALTLNLVRPHLSETVSSVSALNLFSMVDRGMQQVYSKGLKAYDKKNEWLDEFTFFKNNTVNKMRFMLEKLDVPVEGRKKTIEPTPEKGPASDEKTSHFLSWLACLEIKSQVADFKRSSI